MNLARTLFLEASFLCRARFIGYDSRNWLSDYECRYVRLMQIPKLPVSFSDPSQNQAWFVIQSYQNGIGKVAARPWAIFYVFSLFLKCEFEFSCMIFWFAKFATVLKYELRLGTATNRSIGWRTGEKCSIHFALLTGWHKPNNKMQTISCSFFAHSLYLSFRSFFFCSPSIIICGWNQHARTWYVL